MQGAQERAQGYSPMKHTTKLLALLLALGLLLTACAGQKCGTLFSEMNLFCLREVSDP